MTRRDLNREPLDKELDERLVAIAIAASSSPAFSILVERHQSRIRNWLRHLTRNWSLADDLAQETFLLAWRHLESFSGSGTFAGWVTRIAYNCFLKSRHRIAREQQVLGRMTGAADEGTCQPEEAWAELEKLMSILSEEERISIVLSYAHGFSHGEIAEITGMPVGTVKTHIRRGRMRIDDELKKGEE